MNPVTTLVLLADETRARLLENKGVNKGLVQVGTIEAASFDDTQVRYADTVGRSRSGASGTPQAGDRSTTEREQKRENFARHVVDGAEKRWVKGKYDRFVLAAPPHMLGAIRDLIGGSMADKLAFDLPKDLTKIPLNDLPKHFEDKIVF